MLEGVGRVVSQFEAGVFYDGVGLSHDVTFIVKTVECAGEINGVLTNYGR
jgi:hypothetical protein